ncbi:MAG: phage tail sheath subtilisin-like domain-containing protein [Ardenticatenaceae bacterium]|nr:phage tail sheath subtilisin-like domain-containing protein [Anaerolineales bacterium]MCB8920866.1 phage tail sheath subtilisin-like domain-containing protein [Ardenticatenaceae bacterium]
MPVSYATPGVYVEEVDKGSKPIEAAGASMAAFVGITAEASFKTVDPETGERIPVESALNRATLVTNWTQYQNIFGGFTSGAFMPDAVYGYFSNGGGPCYVTSIMALNELDPSKATAASVAIPSASGKGKGITVTAKQAGVGGNDYTVTIKADEKGDTFTMTVGTETKSGLTMKKGDGFVGDVEFETVTLSDYSTTVPADGSYQLSGGGTPLPSAADFIGDVVQRTGLSGLEALDDVRLVLAPDLMMGYDGSSDFKDKIKAVQTAMIADCERLRYRFAILDTPPGLNAQQAKEWRMWVNFDSSYAAMYYPWISVADLSDSPQTTKMMPPSGHMVGVYNRVDGEVGFHKAPANEVVAGALDLELNLTKGEQSVLNPIGVNCIRSFPGRGIRVWGARTLSSDGSWRYINVRRLFIVVGASLDVGLQWVVFEPNDRTLWAKVRRDINAFLSTVWLSGALFGSSKGEAFYVKCDDELNPPEIRDLGQLIVEVGMAPVKPAEFVIVRLSQWAGPNAEA